ncbi:hypothetical protein IV203_020606 [Nitzschia inconspicua]|uniref:Uncharacterized protein n=1 Tax=Nitzschia inconspicua TaxID=303405 RepID=A0A9K3KFF4_9STRA|nr:hypothetical protein IV203_020606 [Nitzschia inconspicua]
MMAVTSRVRGFLGGVTNDIPRSNQRWNPFHHGSVPCYDDNHNCCVHKSTMRLYGLADWRDAFGIFKEDDDDDDDDDVQQQQQPQQQQQQRTTMVPIHLVPSHQVALQGETKYFQFQTKQELRLFERAVDHNYGIFGLGLCIETDPCNDSNNNDDTNNFLLQQDDGDTRTHDTDFADSAFLLDKIPLLEIIDYENMNLGIDFGVFCKAQVVGRAQLIRYLDTTEKEHSNDNYNYNDDDDDDEPPMAICSEIYDETETHFTLEEVNIMAKEMVEMIGTIADQEEEQQEEVDPLGVTSDQDDAETETRKHRFQQALRDAFQSDSQGYLFLPTTETKGIRSWKELSAFSWAAFSTGTDLPLEETYRLHAMDMNRIATRIQLASFWLADKVVALEENSSRK